MQPKVGEIWKIRGMWKWEKEEVVRIEEILESGNLDVNYQLDNSKIGEFRIILRSCLIEKIRNV